MCLPFFFFTFSFSGELQELNFLPSRLHSNLALASSEEKVNLALAFFVFFFGPESILTEGATQSSERAAFFGQPSWVSSP